ncbi:MAG: hypothetical protein JXM69_08715 [Anaerolineae bacterium]|nr:hypothetical protein [Anaerolineae bacterium]
MYETLIEIDFLKEGKKPPAPPPWRQLLEPDLEKIEDKIKEAEATLLAIDTGAHELKRPMEIVLDLSASLLLQIDSDSPLAKDLNKIMRQVEYMHEIIKGIDLMVNYKPVLPTGPVN